jgi:RimJ/RimL family protein N-acetyltransferase
VPRGPLRMQPWAESDADDLRTLISERGDGTPAVARAREIIAAHLTAMSTSGITLLPIRRRVEGDVVGYGGLIIGRATVEEPKIAYELFRHAHGRGYATVAAGAVLAAAIATG